MTIVNFDEKGDKDTELEITRLNQIARQLLERSGVDVTVRLESRFYGGRLVGGKFGMHSRSVTMYTGAIEEQCLQMFGSLERVEEYFAIVLAHELGHAADPALPSLSEQTEDMSLSEGTRMRAALQIEENAWNYALTLIPEADMAMVNSIIEESLEAYRTRVRQTEMEAAVIA